MVAHGISGQVSGATPINDWPLGALGKMESIMVRECGIQREEEELHAPLELMGRKSGMQI